MVSSNGIMARDCKKLQHIKSSYAIVCSQLCGNSLGNNHKCVYMVRCPRAIVYISLRLQTFYWAKDLHTTTLTLTAPVDICRAGHEQFEPPSSLSPPLSFYTSLCNVTCNLGCCAFLLPISGSIAPLTLMSSSQRKVN